jgi:hypothetical protein
MLSARAARALSQLCTALSNRICTIHSPSPLLYLHLPSNGIRRQPPDLIHTGMARAGGACCLLRHQRCRGASPHAAAGRSARPGDAGGVRWNSARLLQTEGHWRYYQLAIWSAREQISVLQRSRRMSNSDPISDESIPLCVHVRSGRDCQCARQGAAAA